MIKFGLIGKSISHSYSKGIHEKFYKKNNINAQYDLINCVEEDLEVLINELKENRYSGFNVTIPYKTKILKYVDVCSKEVVDTNSCNTLIFIDRKVHAYNTDVYGFEYLLEYHNIELFDSLILGSGATSKSIDFVLNSKGIKTDIISRNNEVLNYEYVENNITNKVVINTTPVGTFPNINDSILSKDIACNAKCIIDLVYNPTKTMLMKFNDNSYNGIAMLVYQAAKSFEIWTSIKLDSEFIDELIKEFEVL